MKIRRITALAILAFVLIAAVPLAFYGSMALIERQRINDAEPALGPLSALGVEILSNPVAFNRYCNYIVSFPADSLLSDDSVAQLACLNELPTDNYLIVEVCSLNVTDNAIADLVTLNSVDILDVTKSAITDDGITQLAETLPDTIVNRR